MFGGDWAQSQLTTSPLVALSCSLFVQPMLWFSYVLEGGKMGDKVWKIHWNGNAVSRKRKGREEE